MNDTDRDPLERRIVRTLDEEAAALDAATLSKLRRARSSAVASLAGQRAHTPWGLAFAGSAAAALLAAGLWWNLSIENGFAPPFEDLELVTSSEDLDLYEDLDFYEWMTTVEG